VPLSIALLSSLWGLLAEERRREQAAGQKTRGQEDWSVSEEIKAKRRCSTMRSGQ
jgi:hypothetical protein